MTTDEIIKMLKSIKKDADKLHSGNVAHQRVHIKADIQYLINELGQVGNIDSNETQFIDACISSGKYIEFGLKLSQKEILKIENILDQYDDDIAKIKIRKLILKN